MVAFIEQALQHAEHGGDPNASPHQEQVAEVLVILRGGTEWSINDHLHGNACVLAGRTLRPQSMAL